VEARFSPFGDSANLVARWMHDLRRTYCRHRNNFRHTRWNSYVTWVIWNLISVHLDTMLVLVHGLHQMYHRLRKSFWTHPKVLLGDEAQVDAYFILFGDSANLEAR
jgi:hypothetical protein